MALAKDKKSVDKPETVWRKKLIFIFGLSVTADLMIQFTLLGILCWLADAALQCCSLEGFLSS